MLFNDCMIAIVLLCPRVSVLH